MMTSPDGITWTAVSAAAQNTWMDVVYANGMFVAVSYDGSGNNRVMTSGTYVAPPPTDPPTPPTDPDFGFPNLNIEVTSDVMLPDTGTNPWILLLIGLTLMTSGLVLLRRYRPIHQEI